MKAESDHRGVLFEDKQLGPFPMHRLRRVDKPTTLITHNIQRVDEREHALNRAARGDYGPAAEKEARRIGVRYPLAISQKNTALQLRSLEQNAVVAPDKVPVTQDPKVLSRHIKRLGYFLKADVMGICQLPQSAVYSHDIKGNPIDINYQYAIVIVMSKEYQTVKASQGYDWIVDSISYQCYQHLALVACTMADYIRRLGYPAVAEYTFKRASGGMRVMFPPLLLWAGMGEISRAGIILNPFLGLDFKAAAVLTDLPLEPDKSIDFGLQDFCQHCNICARACPSDAIPTGDKVMHNGYETWKLDERRCASFSILNQKGTFCNTCIKVCPWTRPHTWPHNLVRWAVEHSSLARRIAIKTDTIRGREKTEEEEKWWFDLEEVDGILRIPPTKSN